MCSLCLCSATLFFQAKSVYDVADSHRDELLIVDGVGHGGGVYRSSQGNLPQRCAVPGVQCIEVSVNTGAEDEVAGRGQDSSSAPWGDRKFPGHVAGCWVDGPDGARVVVDLKWCFGASACEGVAFTVGLFSTEEQSFAVECVDVQQAGAWTVGG